MYRKKKNLLISTPAETKTAYTLSRNSFTEGDLNINTEGLRISTDPKLDVSPKGNNQATHTLGTTARASPRTAVTTGSGISPRVISPRTQTQGGEVSEQAVTNQNADQTPATSSSLEGGTLTGGSNSSLGGEEVQLQDLQLLGVAGRGNGGVVQKALHVPSGKIFALKVIPLDVTDQVRKQILLELRTLYESQSPYIVKFYGAFFSEGSISICLEYMDGGALSELVARAGPIPEPLLASVARQVLLGLVYLHKERHLIHRDIKPSNLLISTSGQVKISDFGVSGQLASTISSCVSWVGTVTYMSPERIQGKSYSIFSDIWSFGLSLMELALGHFPYPVAAGNQGVGFWELLDYIVDQPVPVLPDTFSEPFRDFIGKCLQKDYTKRPTASTLLEHPWIKQHENSASNVYQWSMSPSTYKAK